jgi:hypothetical protein
MAGSYKTDILPMFRPLDIKHMKAMGVMLDDYNWMSQPANAQEVYDRLSGKETPQMPPGGPYWDAGMLQKLSDWMNVAPTYQP